MHIDGFIEYAEYKIIEYNLLQMSMNALLHNLLVVLIAETHQVVSSAYVLKDTNLIVMARDVLVGYFGK